MKLDQDAWTEPVMALFAEVGNEAANNVWEARRREGTVTPEAAAAAATATATTATAAAAVAPTSTSDGDLPEAGASPSNDDHDGEAKKRDSGGDDSKGEGDGDGFSGFHPEHPLPVASACSSFEEALDAISGKYVRREHVQATVELGAMEAAAAALDCRGVLRRLATTSSAAAAGGIGGSEAAGSPTHHPTDFPTHVH